VAVKVGNICFLCDNLFLVLKDSNGHWPDDGSSESTTPPGLPSGAAWYVAKTVTCGKLFGFGTIHHLGSQNQFLSLWS